MHKCRFTKVCGLKVDLGPIATISTGRLTVLGAKFLVRGIPKVVCSCECGKILCVGYNDINRGQISCGCYRNDRLKEVTGCELHGQTKSPTYWAWIAMKKRCNNPKAANYLNYGGRGISICPSWVDSFSQFVKDMGEKPTDQHSLDRREVDGNYNKDNCRWATAEEQANNRRNNVILEFYGKKMSLTQWSRISQVKAATIQYRLKQGWPPKLAVWQIAK